MALGLALLIFSRALADGAHEDWIDCGGDGSPPAMWRYRHPGYLASGSLDDRLTPDQVARSGSREFTRLTEERSSSRSPPHGSRSRGWHRVRPVGVAGPGRWACGPRGRGAPSSRMAGQGGGGGLRGGGRPDRRVRRDVALAERLGLDIGSRFVLTAQGATGEIEGQLASASKATFRTGLTELDEGLVHVPIEMARRWLSAPGGCDHRRRAMAPHSEAVVRARVIRSRRPI